MAQFDPYSSVQLNHSLESLKDTTTTPASTRNVLLQAHNYQQQILVYFPRNISMVFLHQVSRCVSFHHQSSPYYFGQLLCTDSPQTESITWSTVHYLCWVTSTSQHSHSNHIHAVYSHQQMSCWRHLTAQSTSTSAREQTTNQYQSVDLSSSIF